MRRNLLICVLAACVLFLGGWTMQAQRAPRIQWEYKVILVPSMEVHPDVLAAGVEGWELVSVNYYRPELKGVAYYFKRPKQ